MTMNITTTPAELLAVLRRQDIWAEGEGDHEGAVQIEIPKVHFLVELDPVDEGEITIFRHVDLIGEMLVVALRKGQAGLAQWLNDVFGPPQAANYVNHGIEDDRLAWFWDLTEGPGPGMGGIITFVEEEKVDPALGWVEASGFKRGPISEDDNFMMALLGRAKKRP